MKAASGMDGEPKALLARALYNNDPDCSDELAFCRGDILTVLDRNVPESEGWWRCLLHGRRGLAPANRLQILKEVPADRPCPPFPRDLEEALASPKETFQVPTLLSLSTPGPVYEQMKSWVERPPAPTVQVYELPELPASARIVCEKMLSFPKQAVFPIPRPAQISSPALYDVPVQSHRPLAPKEAEKQRLYDVPASPRKAASGPPAGHPSRQSVPVTSAVGLRKACYRTLPNPQKPEWIYDTPVSAERAEVKKASLTSVGDTSGPHAVPGLLSSSHGPPSSVAGSDHPHLQESGPRQRRLSPPDVPADGFPAPGDACPSEGSVSYKVPLSFRTPRVEQQHATANIYDIPKLRPGAPQAGKELGKAVGAAESGRGHSCPWVPRQTAWLTPEPDSLSVSSCDSRVSVVSSCSSTSTDSSSSSFSDEPAKELSSDLDLDLARGTVMALQHKVASSVAGLMLFVSSRWRFRDSLEPNVGAIRRATGHIQESLGEFLDFAHGVCGAACNLTDSHLQARIRDQLQAIAKSYETLLEAKHGLDGCSWSLEVLAMDRAQSGLDDLERFVAVARVVPEDVKRFASIVIANGRLLFRQNCEKEETVERLSPCAEYKLAKCIQFPQREFESHQRSAAFTNQTQSEPCPELLEKNWINACERGPGAPAPRPPPGQQDAERQVRLSEHCRLYFGALFKAVGAFHSGLGHRPPPETFIAQSKLVITIGQKLVDTLCQETQDRDVRNEILRGSGQLCSLLKSLALATKQAVLQHPSPAALDLLRAEAEKLEQHARQFRGTLG